MRGTVAQEQLFWMHAVHHEDDTPLYELEAAGWLELQPKRYRAAKSVRAVEGVPSTVILSILNF